MTATNSSFIGKRTAKGLVVRELARGETIGQWFIRLDAEDRFTAGPLRIPFERNRPLEPCLTASETERVLFFARRFWK